MIPVRVVRGSIALFAMAVLVTPFCGLMFGCGCDWPWKSLAENCNYFTRQFQAYCPWYDNMPAGIISVGLSMAAGLTLPFTENNGVIRLLHQMALIRDQDRLPDSIEIAIRILLGIGCFLFTAAITGWITAIATGYPKFFGIPL